MIWKSKGDGEKRKYDFDYDEVNRILSADFNQYTGSSFNKTAGVDFSMSNMSYDANGNIMSMNQKGLKINTSPLIDQMSYTYQTNSNKLSKVVDAVVDKDSKLGDFKYDPATKGSTDYSYDVNGNLTLDNNKKISSITYNYLNLPSVISVTGKGTITYTYDAAGNKLKKVTVDNTVAPSKTTTTLYLGGAVYENDVLQFVGHEEGRIRPVRDVNNNMTGFVYDYFLKDHLGNVRMALTEENKTDQYPPASMETAQATTEEALYANLPQTRVSKPTGYPTDTYTNPNNNVAKVNGNGNKIGPSIILKVMSGDKFNIRVSSWYKKNGATPQSPKSIATDLVTGIINSLTGAGGPVHGAITSAQLTSSGVIPISTTSFLNNSQPAPGSSKPKAYINWVLLDEQFKFVSTGSGAEQVGNDQEFKVHVKNDMPIAKSGYLYVFVSNETPNIDVFFDNLQVTHTRGAVLEETHYYPFGLVMAGISSKALQFGNPENKFKYNKGSELQSKEFSDGSGLEWYATNLRSLDPQLGRWWQIDSKPDYALSLYSAMQNNPILFNDPLGDTTINGQKYEFTNPNHPQVLSEIKIAVKSSNNSKVAPVVQGKPNEENIVTTSLKLPGLQFPGGNKPISGTTATNKISTVKFNVNSGYGDELSMTTYAGKIIGKPGSILTTDASTNNGKPDGASVSFGGIVNAGYGTDGSVSVGLGAFGYESHVGVGIGNGLGQVSAGVSYTKGSEVNGVDLKFKAGGVTGAVAAVAYILSTGGFGALAF